MKISNDSRQANAAKTPRPQRSWADQISLWALKAGGAIVARHFSDALRDMLRAEWLPAEKLQERTEARLSSLLKHAAENVPFYRETYRRLGCRSSQLRTISDLRQLPVVSKETFRGRPLPDFLASNIPEHRRLEWTTSGSTGDPFRFFLDRQATPSVLASHFFYDSWFGIGPFDRSVRIMAPPVVPQSIPKNTSLAARLRYSIHSRLRSHFKRLTERRFSMFDLDEGRAEEIYHVIKDFRPKYILGYTSTIANIADALLRRKLPLNHRLRGVVTIAETLTNERKRLIEDYFNCPIINRYGQREFEFWCAQSCFESPFQFHVNTELVVWEVLREDGTPAAEGELGRVVITNLHNYVMPFIRYDTGDLAVAGAQRCACGRGFPLVGQLEGRSLECVQTVSGVMINPVSLGQYLFVSNDYVDVVRHYQLVVDAPGRMRLLVVPTERFDQQKHESLTEDMTRLLGDGVSVAIETVDEIPLEKSGKRPIIKLTRAA